MAKVLLILPQLPQRMGCPYLGQQYIASSLLADGHRVKTLDLAAIHWDGSDADVLAAVDEAAPDVIGMTLFTYNAQEGYRLAQLLEGRARLFVAGGPHPTVLPEEPLRFGFDVSIQGEGEFAIRELLTLFDRHAAYSSLPGVWTRTESGPVSGPPRQVIEDLDSLPLPVDAYPLYDPWVYSRDGHMVVPGGVMSSRGCPARCTFCANYVTGRKFRYRSAENVLSELRLLSRRYGIRNFPFWDDAFTANRARLYEFCEAFANDPALCGATWTCITPANMVKPEDLAVMAASGCVAINFGIESGSDTVLKSIQKGQRPSHVIAAVQAAKSEGMTTIVNFMFGFPGEGVSSLEETRRLMETLAPSTDFFNNRGVLVPFPGTSIYEAHHEEYGFTNWWLDPKKVPPEPNLHLMDPGEAQSYLESDPTLELDFFHYSDDVRAAIQKCVRFKARHNQSKMSLTAPPVPLSQLQRDTAASVG